MIILRDTIEIKASPEQIFVWLAHFKENYLAWHPDHVECRYLKGDPPEEGSIIYCEEYLHGKLHKFKFEITKFEPNSRIDFKFGPGMTGDFIIEPRGANSLFIADTYVGTKIPLLGKLLDKLMWTLLRRRLEAGRKHMAEEGQNLKNLLEGKEKSKDEAD